ncbi:Uncharacterized protein SCF082_LOCUS46929 [Durusdinium trenchii]|uniref:Uncharacterized protein n=1 Tax=Durusdinium trenchii TaxID=1381693 RepID=A0ABP0RJ19_9DINO
MAGKKKLDFGGGSGELALQLSLKPKHLRLKDLLKYEDLAADARLFTITLLLFESQEQVAFIVASPDPALPGVSVLDLFEMGGEMLALRRREGSKLKASADKSQRSSEKSMAVQIETVAESTWKKRLLQLLQTLADKNGKTTIVQFDSLAALRKSICHKVQGRLKSDSTLSAEISKKVSELKGQASKEMDKFNQSLSSRGSVGDYFKKKKESGKKESGTKRKKCHRTGKEKKRARSSSSKGSSKSRKTRDEEKSPDGSDEEAGSGKSDSDATTLHMSDFLPGGKLNPRLPSGDDDSDLFRGQSERFTPENAKRSAAHISDELLEMLAEPIHAHFKSQSET